MTLPERSLRLLTGLALMCVLSGVAHAGVFRCKAADGTTVFQDSACLAGAETVQKPKADTGPAVDFTLPLAQRIKNPGDKDRLDASLKVIGLQLALKASVEHCRKYAAPQVPPLQSVVDDWLGRHASTIQTAERLVGRYTTPAERVDGYSEIADLMGRTLLTRASDEAARNASNCQTAPAKMRSFLANRYTDIYAAVGKDR
jgi:Domain of unknown function (DUF4124)